MGTPRYLRRLVVTDVSSVDAGAGRGVKVVLAKRAGTVTKHSDGVPTIYNKPLTFGRDIPDDALAYLKREFTQAERDEAAASGAALDDGSFLVKSKQDLKNAIRAVGRAKDPAKAKAHIKSRARALGAEDLIPDSWSKRAPTAPEIVKFLREQIIGKGAIDFDAAQEMIECAEDAGNLMNEVREACCALDCSIQSILADDEVTDKAKAIADSFEQFQEHLSGMEPDEDDDDDLEKAMSNGTISPAIQTLIDKAVKEALAKAAAGTTTDAKDAEIAKLNSELVVAKMSEKHKDFHSSLNDTDKKKFEAMSPAERDAEMEKTKKRAEDDPIYKAQNSKIEELQKSLRQLTDERELDIAKRDARELGMMGTDAGETLMKARRGDPECMKKFEEHMRTLSKAKAEIEKTGHIFREFGSAHVQRGDGSANDELMAKAEELRKKDSTLSPAQAYDKVYTDPANKELVQRERDERLAKIHRVA